MLQLRILNLSLSLLLMSTGAMPQAMAAEPAAQHAKGFQVLLTTSELVVGQNRLAFGLLREHRLLEAADVVVRVYILRAQEASMLVETPAPYYTLEVVDQGHHVHIHPDGTPHRHDGIEMRGIYVTQVTFPQLGAWGLEVRAKGNGWLETSRFTVNVLATPRTLPLGAPAPLSHNLIASDVSDLRQIDTSNPPDPRLHQMRIADAIAQGKPQVIVFATPQLCTSRVCGPVVDVVRMLIPTYGERVVFTHQEVWQDATAQALSPTMVEWNLHTEPWIFVVDGQGIIRAKFEGLTTVRELEAALKQVLDTP
jgi:hypothetical protein